MDGYFGEVRVFAGGFAPANWAMCDGTVLSIDSRYLPLFSVIGAFYGGDGRATFALPDLRGRAAVGADQVGGLSAFGLGQAAGFEQVRTRSIQVSVGGGPTATVHSVVPGSGNNVQPVLGLRYVICLFGKFPGRDDDNGMEGTVGEVRSFGGTYAPGNWAFCDGSVVSLAQSPRYATLFRVIGNAFGGDGQETFALPDLRGRAAIGVGQAGGGISYRLAEAVGDQQVPTHTVEANTRGGQTATVNSVAPSLGDNLQPVLSLNYIICVNGRYPG